MHVVGIHPSESDPSSRELGKSMLSQQPSCREGIAALTVAGSSGCLSRLRLGFALRSFYSQFRVVSPNRNGGGAFLTLPGVLTESVLPAPEKRLRASEADAPGTCACKCPSMVELRTRRRPSAYYPKPALTAGRYTVVASQCLVNASHRVGCWLSLFWVSCSLFAESTSPSRC